MGAHYQGQAAATGGPHCIGRGQRGGAWEDYWPGRPGESLEGQGELVEEEEVEEEEP